MQMLDTSLQETTFQLNNSAILLSSENPTDRCVIRNVGLRQTDKP